MSSLDELAKTAQDSLASFSPSTSQQHFLHLTCPRNLLCLARAGGFQSGVVLQALQKSCSLPYLRFLTRSFTPPPQHGSCTEAAEKRRWEAPQLQREQAIFSRAASQLLGCQQSCAGLCCSTATFLHFLTPSKGLGPCP